MSSGLSAWIYYLTVNCRPTSNQAQLMNVSCVETGSCTLMPGSCTLVCTRPAPIYSLQGGWDLAIDRAFNKMISQTYFQIIVNKHSLCCKSKRKVQMCKTSKHLLHESRTLLDIAGINLFTRY